MLNHHARLSTGSVYFGNICTIAKRNVELTCRKGMTGYAATTGNTKGATGYKPAPLAVNVQLLVRHFSLYQWGIVVFKIRKNGSDFFWALDLLLWA
jgi:hypothetical protein